jgi:hypothetical protein
LRDFKLSPSPCQGAFFIVTFGVFIIINVPIIIVITNVKLSSSGSAKLYRGRAAASGYVSL